MLNVCSYLYIPVFLLRRKLDRTDFLILLMIAGWTAIMSVVGIVRELRIFVPASLMMFVIMARHLDEIVKAFAGALLEQLRATRSNEVRATLGSVAAVQGRALMPQHTHQGSAPDVERTRDGADAPAGHATAGAVNFGRIRITRR
jgi:hypothetical protein